MYLIKEYKTILNNAIDKFYKKDSDLLDRGLNERSVAFRLGLYLNEELEKSDLLNKSSVVVDAEYNKNGTDKKFVYRNCKYHLDGCNSKFDCYIKTDENEDYRLYSGKVNDKSTYQNTVMSFVTKSSESKYMIPDLLVHTRNPKGSSNNDDNKNLIAIEIKTNGERNTIAIDYAKLSYITCETADYRYKLGVHLDFNSSEDNNLKITYFQNGKMMNDTERTFTF